MFVPCIFQTKYNLIDDNTRLAVLGDCPTLGEWTPRRALVANCVGDDGLYEVVAMLPLNTVCHFKWCILDRDSQIIYLGNQKQSAFRVKEYVMYIQSTWNKEFSVISIPDMSNPSSRNKMTLVVFQMNLTKDVKNGQLCLLGNQRTLGSWLVDEGSDADAYGRVITCLPVGTVVEFKWIFKADDDAVIRWEDGPNRTHTIEDGTVTVIECDWEQPETYWRSKHTGLKPQRSLTSERPGRPAAAAVDIHEDGIYRFQPTVRHFLYAGIAAFVGYGLYRLNRRS